MTYSYCNVVFGAAFRTVGSRTTTLHALAFDRSVRLGLLRARLTVDVYGTRYQVFLCHYVLREIPLHVG